MINRPFKNVSPKMTRNRSYPQFYSPEVKKARRKSFSNRNLEESVLSKMMRKVREYEDENKRLMGEVQSMKKDSEIKNEDMKILEKDKSEIEELAMKIKLERNDLKVKFEISESEKKKLEEERNDLKRREGKILRNNKKFRKSIRKLNGRIFELTKKVKRKDSEFSTLRRRLKFYLNNNRRLSIANELNQSKVTNLTNQSKFIAREKNRLEIQQARIMRRFSEQVNHNRRLSVNYQKMKVLLNEEQKRKFSVDSQLQNLKESPKKISEMLDKFVFGSSTIPGVIDIVQKQPKLQRNRKNFDLFDVEQKLATLRTEKVEILMMFKDMQKEFVTQCKQIISDLSKLAEVPKMEEKINFKLLTRIFGRKEGEVKLRRGCFMFRKVYLVVSSFLNTVCIYETSEKKKTRCVFLLGKCEISEYLKSNVFTIETDAKKKFVFQAKDSEEKKKWISFIENYLYVKNCLEMYYS